MTPWFRRRPTHTPRPTPAPTLSIADLRVARHHDLTPEQWASLSPLAKVDLREEFFWAQGLTA